MSLLHGLFPDPGVTQETASLHVLRIVVILDDAPSSLSHPEQGLADAFSHLDDTLQELCCESEIVREITVSFECRSRGRPICRQLCALLLPKLVQAGSEGLNSADRAIVYDAYDAQDQGPQDFEWTRDVSDGVWRCGPSLEDHRPDRDVSSLFAMGNDLDRHTVSLRHQYDTT